MPCRTLDESRFISLARCRRISLTAASGRIAGTVGCSCDDLFRELASKLAQRNLAHAVALRQSRSRKRQKVADSVAAKLDESLTQPRGEHKTFVHPQREDIRAEHDALRQSDNGFFVCA